MKVTIVTPAYNASSTLLTTMRSVLGQSHRDWEHVVVDDGSIDGSADLAESVDDARIRVVRRSHEGVSAARNAGLAVASGDVVTFLDADDVADGEWLAAFVGAFERCPHLGLVCCGARVVADGRANGELRPARGGGLLRGHRGLFLAGTYAIHRSLLTGVRFDERLRIGENTDLGFRLVTLLASSRLGSVCIDRPMVRLNRDQRRADRRDADRLSSAEHTLRKYTGELRTMPAAAAELERIAAVNAARIGYRRRARQHAVRALRLAPTKSASWTTVAGCFVPLLGRRWMRPSAASAGRPPRPGGHPRVSVLLPVFNGGAHIGRAVDSVLAQTFGDFELVVIDDGSTDRTAAELSARAADPRLRIVRHEQNRGLVESLNHGLLLCRGDLIARLDADDWARPTRLARQVAEFDARPELVLSSSPYDRFDAAGRFIRRGTPPLTHAALSIAMFVGNRVLHSTVMFRRDAVMAVGGYDAAWFPVEDYDLWLRLLDVGEFHALSTVEVAYTVRPGSISALQSDHQASRTLDRSRRYWRELTDQRAPATQSVAVEVRNVGRASCSIRRRLKRRGIAARGLERQTLLVANGLLRNRSRWQRGLTILVITPRIAILGRLESWLTSAIEPEIADSRAANQAR